MNAVFAQEAPAASGVSITLSATVLVVLGVWWAWKRPGRDWPGAVIFTCFGVVMANTIVGEIAWQVVGFGAQAIDMAFQLVSEAASSLGSSQ